MRVHARRGAWAVPLSASSTSRDGRAPPARRINRESDYQGGAVTYVVVNPPR